MITGRLADSAPRVVSLFSGIGGGDLGLHRAGFSLAAMCEIWAPARRVLSARFPAVELAEDVRSFEPDPGYELLSAGFPCNDLSHAGKQVGIFGEQSGLVSQVFRIVRATAPEWVLIENVPNLLRLHAGAGIDYITSQLETLGYRWAYRVVDSRAFGVAQRRNRVVVLAGRTSDPAPYLLGQSYPEPSGVFPLDAPPSAAGFYWTEGRRGVGLVAEAVPTLKGGSTIGIPSSPAVWLPDVEPDRRVVLPAVEDGEALQGFERGWTEPADERGERSHRWKLVGNAITVGLGEWIGRQLLDASDGRTMPPGVETARRAPWPQAAYGHSGRMFKSAATRMPQPPTSDGLRETLHLAGTRPLSARALRGFLSRVEQSNLQLPERFRLDLTTQLALADEQARQGRYQFDSSAADRARMARVPSRDTVPEQLLRRELTLRGARYRLQYRSVPQLRWRIDIALTRSKVAVDVRGCFWHACELHQPAPKRNHSYWDEKLRANQERDARMVADLSRHGWEVVVVWEHEDMTAAADRVMDAVRARLEQEQPVLSTRAGR